MPKAPNACTATRSPPRKPALRRALLGGDTRAEERGGFCGAELIWNGSDAAGLSDHHFRISTVDGDSVVRDSTIHDVPRLHGSHTRLPPAIKPIPTR